MFGKRGGPPGTALGGPGGPKEGRRKLLADRLLGGDLAVDVLGGLRDIFPECFEAVSCRIVEPFAKTDSQIDPKLRRAATIAEERAHAHSLSKCWHFVKEALVAAGVVKSRPQTTLAKQAGQELVNNYGFKKLPVSDPYQAPVGSVLVYGAKRAAGHVEIRTESGFVSDFRSKIPSRRPLLGVFAKS